MSTLFNLGMVQASAEHVLPCVEDQAMEMDRKTILVVDDLIDIRKLIRIAAGDAYNVLEAEAAVTALEIIRRHRPCLVLLDIMLPGEMDGLQVLDAVRADPDLEATLVILVTARGQATDYDLGMSRGADEYIIKPFSPALLLDRVKALTQANLDERLSA